VKAAPEGHWSSCFPLLAPASPAGDSSPQTLLEALLQADIGFAALPCVFPHLSAARPDLLDPLLPLKSLPEDSLFAETRYFGLARDGWKEHYKPFCATGLDNTAGANLWVILPPECW
jgi:hypothetical protein